MFTARTGIHLLDAYGATESNAVIGTMIDTRRPGWMGKLVDGFQARVADEDDNEVPDGTPGRIAAARRGPVRDGDRLFRHGRQDGGGLAQSVASHRRPGRARRRGLSTNSSTG